MKIMKAGSLRVWACVFLCIVLLVGTGSVQAQVTLTGSVDLDFVGQPRAIVRNSANLSPPYKIEDAPLSQNLPNGNPMLVTDAVVPSGFHVSRTALYYDCGTDTLFVGLDVSNETTMSGEPTGIGLVGRAWDADGDGDPCAINNPFLDTEAKSLIKDTSTGALTEKYQLVLDFDQDDLPDLVFTAYINGFPNNSDSCAANFDGPCGNPIWVTVKGSLGECLTGSPHNLVADMVYGNDETHRDIEFSLQGYAKYAKSRGLSPCGPALNVFADSDRDQSPECDLVFGTVTFECPCNASVSCLKTARVAGGQEMLDLQLCDLPADVTYKLSATNTGDCPEDIVISDQSLGISGRLFECVPPGETVTVEQVVTYDYETYCGGADLSNTMMAVASIGDCVPCAVGVLESSCESTATVGFPDEKHPGVACEILADKDLTICSFPTTVTYTVRATNTGDVPEKITVSGFINDSDPGTCVEPGETKQWQRQITYDEATYCGHAPETYNATVAAQVGDCATCICGTTSAESSCNTTVEFADKVNTSVQCEILADQDLTVCSFPTTITYTVRATNMGDAPAAITVAGFINDPVAGACVLPGKTKEWQKQVTYNEADYCGHAPQTYSATVFADATACGDCICGVLNGESTCDVTVEFAEKVNADVSCRITADKDLSVCEFPTTITYTVTATNTGDVPVKMTVAGLVNDSNPGDCVEPGATKQWQTQITYDETTYCGHAPETYTATVLAQVDGCAECVCGVLTDESSCDVTVTFPTKVNAAIACRITSNEPFPICSFPTTVTYTVTATNTGDAPVKMTVAGLVNDSNPGDCVGPGATKQWQRQITYDEATYCGHVSEMYSATVFAAVDDCAPCVCGTVTAESGCDITATFAGKVNAGVTCEVLADTDFPICTFPTTVTYTVVATNTGDVPETITVAGLVNDSTPGRCVAPGATKQWQTQITYEDETFCGHAPEMYGATVTANACGDCICGNLTASSGCEFTATFADEVETGVTCVITADKDLAVCQFPTTITYTVTATNTGDAPAKIGVSGFIDDEGDCVEPGETISWTKEITYTELDYCGHEPVKYVANVHADASACGECLCGIVDAQSSCDATVTFARKVNPGVACSITADKDTRICSFPTTVTYTLTVTNTGDAPADLIVAGGNICQGSLWPCVPPGESRQCSQTVTYDEATYCGADGIGYAAHVVADVSACAECVCGNLTAESDCDITTTFADRVNVDVSCEITADKDLRVCSFPTTIVYTVTATNTGDVAAKLSVSGFINDAGKCVQPGQTMEWTKAVTYDEATYCGAAPALYSAIVHASADGCIECVCGTLEAETACDITTTFATRVNAAVACEISSSGDTKICALPTTVKYTLRATNMGNVAVKMRVDGWFVAPPDKCYQPGEFLELTKEITYDEATYCGHAPVTYTATVAAAAADCADCVCGVLSDQSTCDITVEFPRRVENAGVRCEILSDAGSTICAFPTTVTYTVRATNSGDESEKIIVSGFIEDSDWGDCVAPGETKEWTRQITYDQSYCGLEPRTYKATVKADVNGCGECLCGNLTTESSCETVVSFADKLYSGFVCEKTVDGLSEATYDVESLPKTVVYVLKACNTGQTNLDLTITDLGDMPPGGVWNTEPQGGPWTFEGVPAGKCREIVYTVEITEFMIDTCPSQPKTWENRMVVTAALSQEQPGGCVCAEEPAPSTSECIALLTVKCKPPRLYQAYPGRSIPGFDHLLQTGNAVCDGPCDPITAVPGVFRIVPGDNWSNYVTAQGDYDIKSVTLVKEHPNFQQCNWVWNDLPNVLQRGSDRIRLWWPLMYEAPGTKWMLTITWVVSGESEVHQDVWTWTVHTSIESMKLLIRTLREVPWGTCEVPLISSETLYPALLAKLDEIAAAWGENGDDPGQALDLLLELENMLIDNCIAVCPPSPMPNDALGRLGIANTWENPACCKLIVDAEYIGFDLGIFALDK